MKLRFLFRVQVDRFLLFKFLIMVSVDWSIRYRAPKNTPKFVTKEIKQAYRAKLYGRISFVVDETKIASFLGEDTQFFFFFFPFFLFLFSLSLSFAHFQKWIHSLFLSRKATRRYLHRLYFCSSTFGWPNKNQTFGSIQKWWSSLRNRQLTFVYTQNVCSIQNSLFTHTTHASIHFSLSKNPLRLLFLSTVYTSDHSQLLNWLVIGETWNGNSYGPWPNVFTKSDERWKAIFNVMNNRSPIKTNSKQTSVRSSRPR